MVTRYYQYVGNAIRTSRKQHKYTQQQVADKVGIKRSLYSQYERGACSIALRTWLEIANVLELDAAQIAMEALAYEQQ